VTNNETKTTRVDDEIRREKTDRADDRLLQAHWWRWCSVLSVVSGVVVVVSSPGEKKRRG
jgi:hypothetical protein